VDPLLKEIRHNPMLWLLALVPVALIAAKLVPQGHTLLFILSVLAIVPLAGLLSHATESVAEKTGDAAGGLLNATLGNLTEAVILSAMPTAANTYVIAQQYNVYFKTVSPAVVISTGMSVVTIFLLLMWFGVR